MPISSLTIEKLGLFSTPKFNERINPSSKSMNLALYFLAKFIAFKPDFLRPQPRKRSSLFIFEFFLYKEMV